MTTVAYLVVIVAALIGAFFLVRFIRRYVQLRGTRVVACPETGEAVAVEVDAPRAALGATVGKPRFELTQCTRWPERRDCGRECLSAIETAPVDCLVRTKLAAWYAGKACAVCGRTIGPVDWHQRRPALLGSDRRTIEWQEIDAANLAETLATHEPVCWNCHVIETFRRTHPDRVIDNPWKTSRA